MLSPNFGDLAAGLPLKRQTTVLKADITALSQELTTGRVADLQSHLRGDYSILSGLERSLSMQTVFQSVNSEAAGFADAQQLALDAIQTSIQASGPEFLMIATSGETTQFRTLFASAGNQLETTISRLNTRWADRSIFSGTATQGPAIANAQTLLTDLGAAVAGQTTAAGIMAAVDNWFDTPGGGFETTGYLGASTALSPMTVGEDVTARFGTTAADQTLRDSLKAYAVAALVDNGVVAPSLQEQQWLLQDLGNRLLQTNDQLTGMRAGLGATQERIDAAAVQSESEVVALQLARNSLIGVDPYDTAVRLKEVQTQLETVFAVTARASQLSLVAYL
ncbi:flagellin [Pseudoruegeria sp. SK021]|uniref:flagellin n=1 Tax=Pseudoruegeria sp. SK021 TaxID=1933035 RepID=UPI000A21C34D|nr:flagellin [Pseudoruegeria sp. SK021]OSP54663.1 hypothetical protein BV911_11755 [Pseudoruegeria sp. SK021]